MRAPIIEIDAVQWHLSAIDRQWMISLEAGNVLYFPRLAFSLTAGERGLLTPAMRAPESRSITLDERDRFKGAAGEAAQLHAMERMLRRFSMQACALVDTLLPHYRRDVRVATASFRPMLVETREQSWRADDRRLHVDAFAGRPNHGERILRVFANVNREGVPRVWRLGEPFEAVAQHFLPRVEKYNPWQARTMRLLCKTKRLRTEYDHLMLQLHDSMKRDLDYQQNAPQATMPFAAGSAWVCFSDQTAHAAMSGQYLLEQTFHLPVQSQYDPHTSPLAILSRLTGRKLA